MSINGVSANYYPTAYANTNIPKSTETSSFADTIAGKAAKHPIDWEELAFEHAGPNAPQSVKDVWMEASKEAGANGLGYTSNGINVTEMYVQQLIKWYWGGKKAEFPDILGSSVESAIQAAQQALYNFDHPLEPNKVMSMEERQYHMKERQFYVAFLEKLKKLQSEQSDGSMTMNTQYKSEIGEYYLQSLNSRNTSVASAEDAFSARHVTKNTNRYFTVTSYEEIMKNWYEQIRVNQEKNYKSLAEVILEGDPQARYRLYKLAGSSKVYTFDEYVRNKEEEIRKLNEK